MSMSYKETIPGVSGRLKISKVSGGIEEVIFEEDNLIVTSGKSILLNQLYYTSGGGNPLSFAKIGTGGAIDPEGTFLRVPTSGMTDLYAPVATASILKTDEDVNVPSITLLANIDNSIGNGLFINEAGFFAASGAMFNIKVFPGILKNSSFSLNLEWVIKML